MSDEPVTKNDWNTKPGKKAIFQGVMEHFKTVPGDIDECVNNPQTAIDVVTKYGNTDIPPGAKVVFLPQGDNLKGDATNATDLKADAAIVPPFVGMHYNAGSSLIITIPPAGASDDAALKYACSYQIWDN